MTREQVDKAWLDVARVAGRQDREGEVLILRAEIERLKAALTSIAKNTWTSCDRCQEVALIARAALETKP